MERYKNRIRPELEEEIMRLECIEEFGFDPADEPDDDPEAEAEVVRQFEAEHPRMTEEKAWFGLEERYALLQNTLIGLGCGLSHLREHEPYASYLRLIEERGISEKRAALLIQAYEEDKQHG